MAKKLHHLIAIYHIQDVPHPQMMSTASSKRDKCVKIVYIVGYGRSGSTLLDIILGNHPDIIGTGELSFLLDDWVDGYHCGCGEIYQQCPFWRDLYNTPPDIQTRNIIRKIEHIQSFPGLLLGKIDAKEREAYFNEQSKVFAYINARCQPSVIIDSSKSARWNAGRLWALYKIIGLDVYVLHLTRNGKDVLSSLTIKGSNWKLTGKSPPLTIFPTFRAIIGWMSANLLALLYGILLKKRYLRIAYEDLIANPKQSIELIGTFIDVDMHHIIESLKSDNVFSTGHQVGGNRVKFQRRIRLLKEVGAPRDSLKIYQRFLFKILAGWLQVYLGYDL